MHHFCEVHETSLRAPSPAIGAVSACDHECPSHVFTVGRETPSPAVVSPTATHHVAEAQAASRKRLDAAMPGVIDQLLPFQVSSPPLPTATHQVAEAQTGTTRVKSLMVPSADPGSGEALDQWRPFHDCT
jgi:hypothetical protein